MNLLDRLFGPPIPESEREKSRDELIRNWFKTHETVVSDGIHVIPEGEDDEEVSRGR
jgi:hypothetical protein